jgi:uncharacterized RDD family membrane protein YckC
MDSSREDVASWLDGGPRPSGEYPGNRIGLPERGTGSLAPLGRRVLAVAIDWALCVVISNAIFGRNPWGPLGVFALENVALVGTIGTTVGHRLLGLRVVRLGGGVAGILRTSARTALLCVAIPAVVWDADGRGLHDRLAGTVILRS